MVVIIPLFPLEEEYIYIILFTTSYDYNTIWKRTAKEFCSKTELGHFDSVIL